MKYTVSIEIALPLEKVVQLLADPTHIPKWLRGVVVHEPLSGVHGHVGTKSRVVMEMGQQKFEAIETITRREPADLCNIPKGSVIHFEREIVAEGMWSEAAPNTTLWVSERYTFLKSLHQFYAMNDKSRTNITSRFTTVVPFAHLLSYISLLDAVALWMIELPIYLFS